MIERMILLPRVVTGDVRVRESVRGVAGCVELVFYMRPGVIRLR